MICNVGTDANNDASATIEKNILLLSLYVPTPQNGQTRSNHSLAIADELFKYVWPFCGVGA